MMENDLASITRKESLGQGIGNIVANGLIAWLVMGDRDELKLWATDGILFDVALTCLLLPMIVGWIVLGSQKSKLRKGKLSTAAPEPNNALHRLALGLPENTWSTGVIFGLFGVFVLAPLTLLVFQVLGFQTVNPMNYVFFKALWTGAMAVLVVVLAVPVALLRREHASG